MHLVLSKRGNIMYKKIIYLALVITIFVTSNLGVITGSATPKKSEFSDVGTNYYWASEAISALVEKGVLQGVDTKNFAPSSPVTKEQFAKMIVLALDIELIEGQESIFSDVAPDRWSVDYINTANNYMYSENTLNFNPEKNCSREECSYAIAYALGISADKNLLDKNVLNKNFKDENDISSKMKTPVAIIAERGIVKGADGLLRPKGDVTRAEAAVILYRAISYKERKSDGLFITQTPIVGKSTVTLEQAKRWAQNLGAHERFINAADYYWKYGEITGMRPEILYAQAAKETAYGKYTGQVKPEQNNWAGIKIRNPIADLPEDHETFETPEDGVRAHFNHLSAYVGVDPVGQTHPRYDVLKTTKWYRTVKYTEQLGGKWAPDVTYGYNIVTKLLSAMENTK